MATNFPASLDTFPTIDATDQEDVEGKEHHAVHNNEMDAILALQSKVGIDSSTDESSLEYRVTKNEGRGSIALSGAVAIYADLPTGLISTDDGKAYLVKLTNMVYVWDGISFPIEGFGISVGYGPNANTWDYGADPYWGNVISLLQYDSLLNSYLHDAVRDDWAGSFDSLINFPSFIGEIARNQVRTYRMANLGSGEMDLGTDDFTIECLYVPFSAPASSTYPAIICKSDASNKYSFNIFRSGGSVSSIYNRGHGTEISLSVGPEIIGSVNHLVVQRASGKASSYMNGTCVSSNVDLGALYSIGGVYVGSSPFSATNYVSNLDLIGVRVTKGVARYSGSTIPFPTKPFPNHE